MLGDSRKKGLEARSGTVAADPKFAAVALHDHPADCKAHSHSIFLAGGEQVEDTAELLLWNARSAVVHDQSDLIPPPLRSHRYPTFIFGIQRILDQIEHHFLKLRPVDCRSMANDGSGLPPLRGEDPIGAC
jgi:hypothetical protein